ncbi:MAG: single-stranded DNA-binding protein [Candidatus Sericytochromatia bacterium]
MSINYIVLQGEVLNSPEKKYTQDGVPVVSFNISVSHSNDHDEVEWEGDIKVSASKKLANKFDNLQVGTMIAVEGRLYTRVIENRDGSKHKIPYINASNIQVLKESLREYTLPFFQNNTEESSNREDDIPL